MSAEKMQTLEKAEEQPLAIVTYPHPALRYVSKPVKRIDAQLRWIIARMFRLTYEAKGIGLAANQVALPLRLFVVNLASDSVDGQELVFLNPVITRRKGLAKAQEGCLSLPGLYADVTRSERIRVQAYNLEGNEICIDLDGLLARVVQHETDHLDGVLFTDRISEASRMSLRRELEEFELDYQSRRRLGANQSDEEILARMRELEARYC